MYNVRTLVFSQFLRGTFVMEYCGEVITPDQFEERKKQYTNEKRRHYYFMSLRSDEVHVHLHLHIIHVQCTLYIIIHVYTCMYMYMYECVQCA